jgi:hypothetical protein
MNMVFGFQCSVFGREFACLSWLLPSALWAGFIHDSRAFGTP